MYLERITGPADLKALKVPELEALAREIRVLGLAAHSARPAFGERLRGTGEEGLGPRSDRRGGGLFEGVTTKEPFEGQETRIPLGCRSRILE